MKRNRNDYKQNRQYGDNKLEIASAILIHFFGQYSDNPVRTKIASDYEDMKHNTDMFVYVDGLEIRIAIRQRDYGRYPQYINNDFTIRYKTKGNKKSEWFKMHNGYGDFMLIMYEKNDKIVGYRLIDLDVVRKKIPVDKAEPYLMYNKGHNQNKDTSFVAVPYKEVEGCVVDSIIPTC